MKWLLPVVLAVVLICCGCTSPNADIVPMGKVNDNLSGFVGKEITVRGGLVVSYTSKGVDLVYLQDPGGNIVNVLLPGKRNGTSGWDMGDRYLKAGDTYTMTGDFVRTESGVYALYSLNVTKVR